MSDISLDLQRKFEQRWAARFARRVPPSAPHVHMVEKPDQQSAAPAEAKETGRVEAAGAKSAKTA